MSEYSFIRTTPFVLKGDQSELEQVPDEVFMDLHGTGDTRFLYAGCYDQAVEDCVVMGDSCFVLKVRPELRELLSSQLRRQCKILKVYRYRQKSQTRILLAGEVSVRFMAEASGEERRSCLERYCIETDPDSSPRDGTYHLKSQLAADPLPAVRSMGLESAIQEASPLAFAFPARALMAT